ncbi:MAG: DUF992 domain-containing protein [Hyphomicrobium sp.]|nr:DUF992 domain-containing protein [Hyphomicrobium sp.]
MTTERVTARFLSACLLCAALAELPVVNANAASAITGQLACTTKAGEPQAEHGTLLLTCSFQQANGKTARFDGEIERSGFTSGDMPDFAKRVFIWAVYGPPGLNPTDLNGLFVRRNPPGVAVQPGFENALVGVNGSVALKPPTRKEQVPGNPAMTVLQLSLKAVTV